MKIKKFERLALKAALMWYENCKRYSGGCDDCPKQGDCIPAMELIIEMLEKGD